MKIKAPFLKQLDNIRHRLGLSVGTQDFSVESRTYESYDMDINVELNTELDWKENIKIDPRTGALIKDGRVIVVYIKDNTGFNKRAGKNYSHHQSDKKAFKKLHFRKCKTLEDMQRQGKYEKYVGTSSGKNIYEIITNIDETSKKTIDLITPLNACTHCINENKEANQDFSATKENFDVNKWYAYCQEKRIVAKTPNKPKYSPDTLPYAGYHPDWDKISKGYRALREWKCEECGLDCTHRKKDLHTHHIDENKMNNEHFNLQALCNRCHTKKHPHM